MRLLELISEAPTTNTAWQQAFKKSPPPPPKTTAMGKVKNAVNYAVSRPAAWRRLNYKAAGIISKFGTPLTLFLRFLGIILPLQTLYANLEGLTEDYNNKQITGEELEEQRELLFGIFAAQVVTPKIVRWLSNVTLVSKLARGIVWVIGGLGSAFTVGASLAVALGTEAGILWLQNWLSSEEGKHWIIDTLLMNTIVRGVGAGMDKAWSELSGYYEDKPDAGKSGSIAKEKEAEQEKAALARPAEEPVVAAQPGILGPQKGEVDPTKIRRPPADVSLKF
jgi:hypothetical protein